MAHYTLHRAGDHVTVKRDGLMLGRSSSIGLAHKRARLHAESLYDTEATLTEEWFERRRFKIGPNWLWRRQSPSDSTT